MEIVIEYVLLDNFLIDIILLYLTSKTIKLPISRLGLITASSFGAGFAIVSPMIRVGGVLAIVIKFAVALVMVYMMNFSVRKLGIKFLLFVGYTFAFGGALIGIFNFLGISVYDGLNIGYVSELPLGAIIATGFIFLIFVCKMLKSLFRTHTFTDLSCDLTITVNNKSAVIKGFVDTGNVMKTSRGRSVVVINEDTLKYWFSPFERAQILMNKYVGLNHCEELGVSSLGGRYNMKVFDCEIEINGVKKDAALGIAPSKIKCGDCVAIVSKEVVEV